ncbi:MAG: succinylglutamate desuccinylase/aspartoacylase family protein [Deltaproteobacteria bacterium]|nr:MAG: succinylglutamate desuccinylase/aspartoacylase family protein [Deltaproteobacteria bacterium]
MAASKNAGALSIAGRAIAPGERVQLKIPVGRRVSGNEASLPVEVIRGTRPGATLFLSAAIHGDEINGVEIIRRILRNRALRSLSGSLIAVPIVNLFGFVGLSRYLPDRRDLNRSFPGSPHGSLASRLANIFMSEIVTQSTHGIDLHTGAVHRSNLPQIRAWLDDADTARLAHAFGAPVILNSNLRDGSLRQEVLERSVPVLLYEGGEALRFDEPAIRAGVRGVLAVMEALGMMPAATAPPTGPKPYVARSSHWVRAPESGILRARARLGSAVRSGQRLGVIADPLGSEEVVLRASRDGLVIGRTELPLANEGDALFHIASFERPIQVASAVADFQENLEGVASGDPTPG